MGKIPRRRKWQLTPVFLPGKFDGQRSLAGYSPWGRKESDTTKQLNMRTCVQLTGPSLWLRLKPNSLSFPQMRFLLRFLSHHHPPVTQYSSRLIPIPAFSLTLSSCLLSWCPLISTVLCNEHFQLVSSFPFSPSSNPSFTVLLLPIHACVLNHFSHVWFFGTPWTVACQARLSMGFSRQEYWSRLPCLPV